jgi:rod shape determining protein RodA
MVDYVQRIGVRAREEREGLAWSPRDLDWLLLGAVGALVAYGLWAIAGVTQNDVAGKPDYYVVRQGIFAAVGCAGLVGALLLDPELYRRYYRQIYFATVVVIAVVFAMGPIRGSKRWIDLGFFRFQPSEFGKLVLVLALAGFLADRAKRINELDTTLRTVGLALLPALLVYKQPDIGTALVYGAALGGVLFVAGVRWLHLGALLAATATVLVTVLVVAPAAGIQSLRLQPYQQARITGFTHPDSDPSGATYNVNQSITAVGAGGLRGRGVNGATQTTLGFNPEHATDFAFASVAEQRGFLGAAFLLLLYLLVVWRGLRVVALARDAFSAIVAGGITLALLFQVCVNVGMTMGIAPITGIPLPFVSVGGSSMIANLTAMGVLLAIHARGRTLPRR